MIAKLIKIFDKWEDEISKCAIKSTVFCGIAAVLSFGMCWLLAAFHYAFQ